MSTRPMVLPIVVCSMLSSTMASDMLRFDFSPSPLAGILKAKEATRKLLACPRCDEPPKIDGQLDDRAWALAAHIERFTVDRPNTQVRACFDQRAVYLGVTCTQLPGQLPQAKQLPRDDHLFADDCIEIWFDPERKGSRRYQFAVNAVGSFFDQTIKDGAEDPSHDPQWECATRQEEGRWHVEAAIPARALALARWTRRIGFNIGRNGPALQPHTWHASYGDTSESELVLEGMPEASEQAEDMAGTEPRRRSMSLEGDTLAVEMERTYARPGDRWIEATLEVFPARVPLETARIQARLFPLGSTEAVAQEMARPERSAGTLSVDLRRAQLKNARLVVELMEANTRTGVAEVFLSARECEEPLAADGRIAITIDPPKGVDGLPRWPVTFGVPFPAGAVWDTDDLRLIDSKGSEIPMQKETAALWAREGAVKWLRFDALVSPKDGCYVQRSSSSRPEPQIRVVEEGDRVVLDTGTARYVLGRGISPIREVWLGDRRVAETAGTRGLYVMDQKDRVGQASADGESMDIEARGPIAACVRFEGFYRTSEGEALARHITRVEAFAGQPFANVTHTLVLTRDTNEVWFRDIGWEFRVQPGSSPAALFALSRDDWSKTLRHPLDRADESAYLLQDSHFRFGHGKNHFSVVGGEQAGTLAEGEECGDWAALAGSDAGLMVSCREAARQHPKELEVSANKIVLRLFSNRAGQELDFRSPALVERWNLTNWFDHVFPKYRRVNQEEKVKGFTSNAVGWAKTHELRIAPLTPQQPEQQAAHLSRLHREPVYAHVDPHWIYRTKVMGRIHPRDVERFPRAEKVIEETFNVWERRIHDWGEYGFVDYFAGPQLEWRGKYARPYRYCIFTYTLRGDLWLAYARSADRRIRAFTEGTNRAYLDNVFCHWDGNNKTRGLYVAGKGYSPLGDHKGCLPYYWEGSTGPNASSSTGLHNFTYDYYLTGYRRAKDHVLEYAAGLKSWWTPARVKRDWRSLMTMRMAAQAYAFTWDPELRALAHATTDIFSDAEGELGLTKNRPYHSTTYKTNVDIAALLDAWEIFGDRRYYNLATKVAKYWWPRHLAGWPIFYCSPIGRINSFLYHETGDPAYAQVLAVKLREAATAYDPDTGVVINHNAGRVGAEDGTFVFQGIPYAQDVLTQTGAHEEPLASWVAYEDFGYPVAIVVKKGDTEVVQVDIKTDRSHGAEPGAAGGARVTPVAPPQTPGLDLDRITQQAAGAVAVRIPKDAPASAYRIVPDGEGTHCAVAHSQVPMVLHAPEYWRPMPRQHPPVRWYFNVPQDARDAQVFVENPCLLFDADGNRWPEDDPVQGWVDLPNDAPGLWSFALPEGGLVRVRNLPPFFAAETPKSYFAPPIPWSREEIPPPAEAPDPKTVYVPGAIQIDGNQALYVKGRRSFQLDAGPDHPSGDGPRFLPFSRGTIEFFIKPDWSTFSLPGGRHRYYTFLRMPSTGETWRLSYVKDPAARQWLASHVLYGYFMSEGKQPHSIRAYRQTAIESGVWTHIAWVWGPERVASFKDARRAEVLTARIFVNGRLGMHYAYRVEGQHACHRPKALSLYDEHGAAYDELRLSDVPRYTKDFPAPPRDQELKLDEHTRALFHFNGGLKGESHGYAGEMPVELKP